MITQQHLASFKHADRDLYAREKVLNSAIVAADITSGWEEYLEIFDAFYADHVESATARRVALYLAGSGYAHSFSNSLSRFM